MLGRDQGPQRGMVDLDLLPQIYVPRRAVSVDPIRVFGGLAALGALLLVYLIFQRGTVNAQLAEVEGGITEAEVRRRIVVLPREVRELQDKVDAAKKRLEGLEKDSVTVKAYQWPWGRIMQRLADLKPEAIELSSMAQKEADGITLEGITEQEASVVAYAGRLRLTGLFSDVSIQSLATKLVPLVTPAPAAPPGFPSFPPPPSVPRAQPTATPTPTLDYILVSKTRTTRPGSGRSHEIRGQIVDRSGRPVEGLTFRILSCCPIWSALYPKSSDTPMAGTFEFFVGAGNFTVEITNAVPSRAQAATQLSTVDAGRDEYFEWHIVFQKITNGPAVAPSPTPTFVPTPSGTPVFGPQAGLPAGQAGATATPTATIPRPPTSTPTPTQVAALQPAATPILSLTPGAPPPSGVPTKEALGFTISLTLRKGG